MTDELLMLPILTTGRVTPLATSKPVLGDDSVTSSSIQPSHSGMATHVQPLSKQKANELSTERGKSRRDDGLRNF